MRYADFIHDQVKLRRLVHERLCGVDALHQPGAAQRYCALEDGEAIARAFISKTDFGLRATPDSPRVRAVPSGYVNDPDGSYVILYDPLLDSRPLCGCDGEHCGDGPTCQYVKP